MASKDGLAFAERVLLLEDFAHEYPRPGVKERIAELFDAETAQLRSTLAEVSNEWNLAVRQLKTCQEKENANDE